MWRATTVTNNYLIVPEYTRQDFTVAAPDYTWFQRRSPEDLRHMMEHLRTYLADYLTFEEVEDIRGAELEARIRHEIQYFLSNRYRVAHSTVRIERSPHNRPRLCIHVVADGENLGSFEIR